MINFCEHHDIAYELCGKIVVATSKADITSMNTLYERGQANGLENLTILKEEELKEYEPHVNGIAGIHVPQTGIANYKQVSEKYAELIQEKDGEIHLNEKVMNITTGSEGCYVVTNKATYSTKLVVNCSGLYSDKVAQYTQQNMDVKIIPFRGEYYELNKDKEHLVKNLIYPVPDSNFPFLGVHFTRMINGGIEAGPNAVLAFGRESYTKSQVNLPELAETLAWPGFQKVAMKYWKTGIGEMYRSFSKAAFTKALQKLMPDIQEEDLSPGGAGIRAQACDRSGKLIDDFLILENAHAVNVCNAPSPAATSSLAIGDTIAAKVLAHF